MFNISNPIKSLKAKHYQLGYQEGKKDSFDVGYEKGFKQATKANEQKLNSLYKLFDQLLSETEKELDELKSQLENIPIQNNNSVPIQQTQKSDRELIDEYLLFYKSLTEIMNLNFFESTLYRDFNSKQIYATIQLIDYFINSFEIKSMYYETWVLLPQLKKAFEKVYQNKLVVEEAEKF